jgi:hypothetical protein
LIPRIGRIGGATQVAPLPSPPTSRSCDCQCHQSHTRIAGRAPACDPPSTVCPTQAVVLVMPPRTAGFKVQGSRFKRKWPPNVVRWPLNSWCRPSLQRRRDRFLRCRGSRSI